MNWHVSNESAASYRDGTLVGARAASVEAHVLECEQCRQLLQPHDDVMARRLATVWEGVEEHVDQPRLTFVERALMFLRVPADEARLLAAAPSLQLSWLVSLVVVVGGTSLFSLQASRFSLLFVILAPALQVLSVAGAYGARLDPTYELSRATPYPTLRLLMLRAAAVLVASFVITGAAALLLTDQWAAAAWLLPSLALVSLTLLLAKWLDVTVAGATVCIGYVFVVTTALFADATVHSIFGGPVQVAAIAVTVACALILFGPSAERAEIRRTS